MCMYSLCSLFLFGLLFCLFVFACLFSLKREKEDMELEEWRCGEDLGGDEREETMIQIYCMKKIVFN